MQNQNQNVNELTVEGDNGKGSLSSGVALSLEPVRYDPDSLSQPYLEQPQSPSLGASTQTLRSKLNPFLLFAKRADVILVVVLALSLVGVFVATSTKSSRNDQKQTATNGPASQYETQNIPLSGLVADSQGGIELKTLTVVINGELTANKGLVITPSLQPSSATSGQIYYNRDTNQLMYYNGAEFVALEAQKSVVESLGGVTGPVGLAGGLGITGNQLLNTGVLSLGGAAGTIILGNGLSLNNNVLQNSGVLTITAGTPNVTVTNNGGGDISISVTGAGTGTVSSSGGIAGIIPVFTSSQNIEDSILSQSGANLTASGSLNVTGSLTLGTALSVSNGGTGATTLAANGVIVGNGTSALSAVTAGGAGLCLLSTAGAPSFAACPSSSGGVTSLNALSGVLTLAGTAGQISVSDNGTDTVTLALNAAVTLQGNTFNGANQLVQLNASTQLPAVSGALLTNLNASALASGTVPSSVVSGSYTGITGVGTVTVGTWQGTAVADGFVADNLTISSSGSVDWTALSNYPTGCSAGQAVTAVGDTLTCAAFAAASGSGSYINNTTTLQTSANLNIQSGVTTNVTANFQALGSQTADVIRVRNSADTVTVFAVNPAGDVTATSFTGNGSGLTALNGSNISSGTVANARLVNSGALTVTAGTGLSGGGSVALGSSTTLNLADTAVTPGSYGSASQVATLTVDQQGRLTAAGNTSIAIAGTQITSGTINDARLSANVTLQGNTFNGPSQLVQLNASTELPAVSGVNLTSLNASNLASGTVSSARISGSYTGITGVGTIGTGVWQGTAVADGFVADNLTISSSGTVDWTALNNYPTGCSAGQAVTAVGDTLTCAPFAAASGSGSYINNTTTLQTSANFNVQSGNTTDITANFQAFASQTADIIRVRNSADTVTVFAVAPSGAVTATSFTGDGSGLTALNGSNISSGTVANARLVNSGALTVTAGTGLSGGGSVALGGSTTINLGDTAVTPGSFGSASQVGTFTVDQQGRLTAAGNSSIAIAGTQITSGTINDARLSANVTLQGNTFNGANQLVQLNASTELPAVSGVNLTALNATQLTSGTVPSARISGSYTGITGVGTIGTGVWQGTPVGITYGGTGANTSQGAINAISQLTTQGDLLYHNGANSTRLARGNNGECLVATASGIQWGSCSGSAGITGSGTSGQVTFFNGASTVTSDADLLFDGTTLTTNALSVTNNATVGGTLAVQGASLTLGDAGPSGTTGSLVFNNDTNANTVTIQSGITGTSYALTLPTDVGGVNQCLKAQDGTGTLFWDDCEGGTGGTSGVSSVNSLDGALIVQGTANHITVNDNGTDTITLDVGSSVTLQGNSFNGPSQLVQLNASGELPAVSGVNLTNLNASNLASGTVPSARISGSYTGLTGVGTIGTGTWQGTAVADTYVADNLTISSSGTVDWTALNNYPTGCSAGQAVTAVGDTLTCAAFAAASGSGSYINNTTALQTSANFNIQTAATTSVTANFQALASQTADIIRVRNSADTVTVFAVAPDGAVTATSFTGDGSGLTALNGSNVSSGTVANARLVNSGALTVTAGTGLTGGGSVALGSSTTLDLADTAVTPGSFGSASQVGTFTVDQQGRLTAAGNSSIAIAGTQITSGTINDARLSANVTLQGNSFNGPSQLVQLNASSELPSVSGVNLTALNATQLTSGTVPAARVSGSYTGITGVGTIGAGVWQGTAVADTYVADNLTISSSGTVDWTALTAYPTGCSAGQAVTAVGDTLTCAAFAPASGSGSYINNTTTLQTSANFNVQSGNTTEITANFQALTSQTADIIRVRNSADTLTVFAVAPSGAVTATSFTGDGSGLTALNATELTTGTVASARISGSYTGITGVGTIGAGTWQGTAVADAYVADNLTISSSGNVDWTALTNYPTGCSAGQAVTAVGDTLTCAPFAAASGSSSYINNTTSLQTSANFNIQSSNTTSVTANFQVLGSQTADIIRVRNSADTVTVFAVNPAGDVTATSFTGDGSALTALNASQLTSGTVPSARISGSYTGITGLGTIGTGTWQGTAVADAYVADNLTISSSGTVDWTALNSYPTGCSAGQAVTAVGDTLTCSPFAAASGSASYINNTTTLQTSANFNIQTAATTSVTANFQALASQTADIIRVRNSADTVTVFSVSPAGDVTATSFTGDGSGLTALNGSNISSGTVANARLVNSGALTVTAGTGLSGGGSVALGGSTSLSVSYGSSSGTAVQGNTTLTCPSGTGNLSGGGDVITLGTGGTCSSIDTVASPTFTGNVTVQGTTGLTFNTGAGGDITFANLEKIDNDTNGQINLSADSGAIILKLTGTAATLTNSAGNLTFDSSSNTIVLGATETTLQRTASGNYTIDLNDSGTTKLLVTNSGGGAGVISAKTGYQINNSNATSGHYLRGDGTNYVDSTIQAADVPDLGASYIKNQSSQQSSANFNIDGTGVAGTALQAPLFQTADGATASAALTLRSGNTTGGTGLATGSLTIKTGDGSGTDTSSGNITIDSGSKSGTGTAGTITVGGTNASALTLGRSGVTTTNTGNLTIQGGTTTIGTNSQAGSLVLHDGTGETVTITSANQITENPVLTIPDAGATDTICLQTLANCSGSSGANTALSNLVSVAINTSLLSGSSTIDLGSATNPFRNLYLGGTATNNFLFSGTATAPRTYTLDDLSGSIALVQTAGSSTAQTGDINASGTIIAGTAFQGTLVKSADGAGASGAISLRSGNTTGGSGLSTGGVTIKSGDGSGTDTSSGSITIDSGSNTGTGTAGAINIGTTNSRNTTIGNGSGATAVSVLCGTGACGFGNNAVAHTTTVGSATGAAITTIQGGTGGLNIGNDGVANTIQIGTTTGAVAQTINIGNNATASSTSNITIGSTIAGTTAIQGATTITNRTSGSADTLAVNNSTSTGNIAVFKDNGNAVLTVADGGSTTVSSDSATALKVTSSGGSSILNVDASIRRVTITSGLSNQNTHLLLDVTGPSHNYTIDGSLGTTASFTASDITDTNAAISATTEAIAVNTNINVNTGASSSGTKTINGIRVAQPTVTNCSTTGTTTCTWNGVLIGTQSSGTNRSALTQNALNISATGVSAGTLNGLQISSITGNSGIETAVSIGAGWDTGINLNNNTLVNVGNAGTDFNSNGGLTLAENLTIQGVGGITFSTGIGGDITFANLEKIDNDTDGQINLSANSGALAVLLTGTAATLSNSAGALTLDSASGTLILGSTTTTLQKSATAFSFDLNNASDSTLTVTNAGSGVASLSVEGDVNIGSSRTYKVNGTQISSANLSNDSNLAKLSASQTFTGTNTFQPTTDITGLIVKQTSAGSPTADIFNLQTANSTSIMQVTGPAANEAAVTINSVGATRALTLTSQAAATWSTVSGTLTVQGGGALTAKSANSASGNTGTVTLSSGDQTGSSLSSGNVLIQSGDAAGGTNSSSGNVTIDAGSKSGTGTTGTITIGATNSNSITIGNGSGATAVSVLCGTGACGFGNNAVAHTTTVGSATGAAITTIQGGTGGLNIGNDGVANTIQIGTTTGAVAQTINIGNNATGSSTNTVVIGNLLGSSTTTIQSGTGHINLQAGGTGTVDRVQIGAGGAGGNFPDYLALDVRDLTGDPAGGAEGYMYYNTIDNKFRCFQGAAWMDCIGSGGSTDLQGAYNNSTSPASIVLSSAKDGLLIQNPSSSGTDSGYTMFIEQLNTGAVEGLRVASAGTGAIFKVTDSTATAVDVLTIADGGAATFRSQTDSATAFRVQNAAGTTTVLTVDTSTPGVVVQGSTSAGSSGRLFFGNDGEISIGEDGATDSDILALDARVGHKFYVDGTQVVDFSQNGKATFAAINDAFGGLTVTQSNTNPVLTVDTGGTEGSVSIGYAADGAATVLYLDGDATSDPSGGEGGLYYNTSTNKFRCFEGAAWEDCISSLQGAYNNSAGAAPSILTTSSNAAVTIQTANSGGISAGNELLGVRASQSGDTIGNSLFTVNSGGVGINIGGTGNPATTADLSFGQGADRTINVITQGTAATAGNKLTIRSATGNTSGAGGQLVLQAGDGGTSGIGGEALVKGGTAGGGNTAGGAATLQGGAATGTGTGGTASVLGGAASSTSGSAGGSVAVTAANGTATSTGGAGGNVTITAGNGTSTGANNGGTITLKAGSPGTAGTAGKVLVKNASDAAVAFQIQNAGGTTNLFTADTTNSKLIAGVDLVASGASTATTATTNGAGTNTTTVNLTGSAFADNDVIFIDNAGQDFYTRITAGGGTASLTVSPAVTFEASRTVTKYTVQSIGATSSDYTTQANRFFQGYFLGGVVAGASSTTLSDQRLSSSGTLNFNATDYIFRNSSDSATAFQVQQADADPVLTIDTSGAQVLLGKAGTGGINGKLVFNTATASSFTAAVQGSGSATASYTLTLPAALGSSGDCLKDTNGSGVLGFGSCGGGSGVTTIGTIDTQAKSANGAVISGTSLYLQTADATHPGLVSSSGTQVFAGDKTFTGQLLQNSDSAAAFKLMDSTNTYTNLSFSSATNHLKIYDFTTRGVNDFAEIYYSSSAAVFKANTGTTQIGNGTGDINASVTNSGERFNFAHTVSSGATASSSDIDFLVQRNLAGGSNNLQGTVLKVEDISNTSGTISPELLYINGKAGSTGNLIAARLNGAGNEKFVVSSAGTVTIAASQSYTGAGAVTLSSGGSSGLTLDSASNTLTVASSDTTLTASGLTTITLGGFISAASNALTLATTSNGAINLSPNGSGDVVVTQGAGSNLQITASAASTVDQVVISNSGQASTTAGVDGLQITFGSSNASGDALHITPSFTTNATATYNVIDLDAFTATRSAGTATVNGLSVGNLTESGTVTSSALNIGTGWDNDLIFNDTTPTIKFGATDNTAILSIMDNCSSGCANGGTSPNELFQFKDISTNFGGLAISGGFMDLNSYWGQEYNQVRPTNCAADATQVRGDGITAANCTTALGNGPISTDITVGTGASCAMSSVADTANGIERIAATDGTGNAACLEYIGSNTANDAQLPLNSNNLPVVLMKVKPGTASDGSGNLRYFVGIGNIGTAASGTTTAAQDIMDATNDTGVYFSNCTTPTTAATCTDTTWNAHVQAAGSTAVSVDCGVTISTSQFALMRIEVVSAGGSAISVRAYVDGDVSDGVNFTACPAFSSPPTINGVAWGWFGMVHRNGALSNGTTNFDIDFVRIWQDDATPTEEPVVGEDNPEINNNDTPPLITDSSNRVDQIGIIDFMTATGDDTVFDHNVYVKGTLFADKIMANQIEGLEVYADKLASLQQVLDSHQQAQDEQTNGAGPAAASNSALGMEFMNINLSGGLVVGGDAEFHGNAFFYRLVTFVEKTVFNNDITLAGHIGTRGAALTAELEPAAGLTVAPQDSPDAVLATAAVDGNDVSGQFTLNLGDGATNGAVLTLKFTKPYTIAPHILLTPANDKAGQVQYYVQSTPDGFKLFLLNTPPSGTSLQFNYWASESIVSSN